MQAVYYVDRAVTLSQKLKFWPILCGGEINKHEIHKYKKHKHKKTNINITNKLKHKKQT